MRTSAGLTPCTLRDHSLYSNLSFETITSGNFNSYTASGGKVKHYCGSNVNSFTNAPSGLSDYAFSLDVFPIGTGTTYTKQVLHYYGTTPATFERQQYWSGGAQWSGWQVVALKSDPEIPKRYATTSSNSVTTDISVNGGEGGKTILVIASGHTSSGDATASAVLMLRCGYNGNHVSAANIAGSSNWDSSFSANSSGMLVITGKAGFGRQDFMLIANK